MTDTKLSGRGRPRGFDIDAALETGQRLFHAHGYEGVSLAMLTEALGIKPPSFYKAFGSKAEFFARVLEHYGHSSSALTLKACLHSEHPPIQALAALLENAAHIYGCDPEQRGCLVLETACGSDQSESAALARDTADQGQAQIREFIARTHPQVAEQVTDYVISTLCGLSASARKGMSEARLVQVAQAATAGLEKLLAS